MRALLTIHSLLFHESKNENTVSVSGAQVTAKTVHTHKASCH